MLIVEALEVLYSDVVSVLRGVNLAVPVGSIVALLGPNGSGKTTLLRAVSGLLGMHNGRITHGAIRLGDQQIHTTSPSKLVGLGIKQVLEGRRVFAALTVEENLRVGGHHCNSNSELAEQLDQMFLRFPVLKTRRRDFAGYLSGGEQTMLAIARGLMSDPTYLLLDEPSLGLAPRLVDQVNDLILEINAEGTAILLVEQNARVALSIANHGYVLETGRIVLEGPAEHLAEHPDIAQIYLGGHRN